jgi:hypothetical protein
MKAPLFSNLLFLFFFSSLFSNAQTIFYSENFQGTHNWTLNTSMGAEGTDPNFFKVSANEGGVLPPGCGVANNGNNTLHITSVFNSNGGASYDAGGLCGLLFCPLTNRRAESPTINCSGKTSISLSFNFISVGQGLIDNASILYYDGAAWSTLVNSIKSNVCGNGQGQWTNYSVALPASADNNPMVKIGFKWENNDDGVGSDPSFAADEITLSGNTSGGAAPVPNFSFAANACSMDTLLLNGTATNNPTSWLWQVSPSGPIILNSASQNTSIVFPTSGTYTITLTASNGSGSNSTTQLINVSTSPSTAASNNGPYCQGETIFLTATGTPNNTFTWTGPSAFSSTQQNPVISNAIPLLAGVYTVTVTLGNCSSTATTTVVVNPCTGLDESSSEDLAFHPNPANDQLFVSGKILSKVTDFRMKDFLGRELPIPKILFHTESQIGFDVSPLENGVYFLQIGKKNFPVLISR